jgi:hypothetical protein
MAKRKHKIVPITESLAQAERLTADDHRDLRIVVLEAKNALLEAERAREIAIRSDQAVRVKVSELAAKYGAKGFDASTGAITREPPGPVPAKVDG